MNSRGPLVRGRPWSWITGRPRLMDGLIVAFNLAIGLIALVAPYFAYRRPVIAALVVAVAIQAGALWWRRSHPVVVLLTVVVVEVATIFITTNREVSGAGLAFAVYAVSVYSGARVRLVVAAAAIALILTGVIFLVLGSFETSRMFIPAGASSLVAWVIGDYIRGRRAFFIDLISRHRRDSEMSRRQAVEEERLRIARELHDVVAHNVSVMAIQAGAARMSGGSSNETLQSIETTARDTLSELNRLLGVLRKQPEALLDPQPGLDQVDALLKSARDAGLEATYKVTGDRRPLSTALDLSAYRIVQEAITNVLKHADASRLEVVVDYQPDVVTLTVTDNGSGPAGAASGGHGLIGMHERVALFGGDLTTGSSSLGGFTVRATLPVKA